MQPGNFQAGAPPAGATDIEKSYRGSAITNRLKYIDFFQGLIHLDPKVVYVLPIMIYCGIEFGNRGRQPVKLNWNQ
jgi:hypothetical protein